MGTTSLYPHNHPIKYLLNRRGLQRSSNFRTTNLISNEVGLCTQKSLSQNLHSSHYDRPNNENLIFINNFMRWYGRGFISHITWDKLHKSSFYRAVFPKVPPQLTTPSSLHPASKNLNLFAPLGETKAWPSGVLILPPAWHSTTRSQGSPLWCAGKQPCKDPVPFREKEYLYIVAKHRSAHLSRDGIFFLPFSTNFVFLDESEIKLSLWQCTNRVLPKTTLLSYFGGLTHWLHNHTQKGPRFQLNLLYIET